MKPTYTLYIGYHTHSAKHSSKADPKGKTNAVAFHGWSAVVTGFDTFNEAIQWAHFKIYDTVQKIHYWFWVFEVRRVYQTLVYCSPERYSSAFFSLSRKVDERKLTIVESDTKKETSRFPQLVKWSPEDGLTKVYNFITSFTEKWNIFKRSSQE